jgi:hypothetical protein
MSREISEVLRLLVAERAYRVCEYCLVHFGFCLAPNWLAIGATGE